MLELSLTSNITWIFYQLLWIHRSNQSHILHSTTQLFLLLISFFILLEPPVQALNFRTILDLTFLSLCFTSNHCHIPFYSMSSMSFSFSLKFIPSPLSLGSHSLSLSWPAISAFWQVSPLPGSYFSPSHLLGTSWCLALFLPLFCSNAFVVSPFSMGKNVESLVPDKCDSLKYFFPIYITLHFSSY